MSCLVHPFGHSILIRWAVAGGQLKAVLVRVQVAGEQLPELESEMLWFCWGFTTTMVQ